MSQDQRQLKKSSRILSPREAICFSHACTTSGLRTHTGDQYTFHIKLILKQECLVSSLLAGGPSQVFLPFLLLITPLLKCPAILSELLPTPFCHWAVLSLLDPTNKSGHNWEGILAEGRVRVKPFPKRRILIHFPHCRQTELLQSY